ncbi:MAG: FUSC family protein [Ferruginibacter sp.]|nr:FUSC family protein [Ferruginibacter sp.]
MDTVQRYRNFLNGRHFSEGIRVSFGVLFPAIVLYAFGYLSIGITLSIAALSVSITDVPGPVKHRLIGMGVCVVIITLMSALTGEATKFPFLLGLLITLSGFFFSMLTVYGMRSSALGVAALYMVVISMDANLNSMGVWEHTLFTFIGGAWYFLFSLVLSQFKPYKIIQQVLGDLIIAMGNYLSKRGEFFGINPNYDDIYRHLLQQQVEIEKQQSLTAELIYKTRRHVRETNRKARSLLTTYLHTANLLDSIMTSFQNYNVLNLALKELDILPDIQNIVKLITTELHNIGLAIKSEEASDLSPELIEQLNSLREKFETLRTTTLQPERLEAFVSLGRIINNLEEMLPQIEFLHAQTKYKKFKRQKNTAEELTHHFSRSRDLNPSIFLDNLHHGSNIFRHALRVSLSLLSGYLIAHAFNLGAGNWILLTIIVILKPAFSLSRQRNKDRLFGTILGAILGFILVLFVPNNTVLFIMMVTFMVVSFSFIRTNYFIAVWALTTQLIILYFLMFPQNITHVLIQRIFETGLGSLIAYAASLLMVPAWEYKNIKPALIELLKENKQYYHLIAEAYIGKDTSLLQIRKSRQRVLVSLSNLSDALNRMLSEPKQVQIGQQHLHQFVVINYAIASHLAALSLLLHQKTKPFTSPQFTPVTTQTNAHFIAALNLINGNKENIQIQTIKVMEDYVNTLINKRKIEISQHVLETETKTTLVKVKSVVDQFNFIQNLSATLVKLCREYAPNVK